MTKEELIEFLKENLKIKIYFNPGCAWTYPELEVKLELEGEVISEHNTTLYLNDAD